MKYLICQDWENTSNNHAGMKYMSYLLKQKFPHEYKVITLTDKIGNANKSFLDKLRIKVVMNIINPAIYIYLAIYLSIRLNNGDKVYLLEYMEPLSPQNYISNIIKIIRPKIYLAGLVHLTPQVLESKFSSTSLKRWLFPLDKILTFGTSLTEYFVEKNIQREKIDTLFHYVDIDYYSRESQKTLSTDGKLKVIAMGNQKRNYNILRKIVENSPEVNFVICKGVSNIDHIFDQFKNVELVGFVEENELKNLMNAADISLNVMDDTVGSNVITTSMAMGLAMIVSDVGSIRDYCDNSNTFFCKNDDTSSFKNAIKQLFSESLMLKKMQDNALTKSKDFTIEKFHSLLN